jgi:hypothetical protein
MRVAELDVVKLKLDVDKTDYRMRLFPGGRLDPVIVCLLIAVGLCTPDPRSGWRLASVD